MKKKIIIGILCAVVVATALLAATVVYRIHLFQGMNPEGMYFDSDGVRIHYTVTGTGAPVILVHGLAVNAGINFNARGLTAALAKEYQVITLDNRGHGRSEKHYNPDAYGIQMCEDIVRLMDHLHIEKAQVLGYSMGGFIVLKLATLHPERLLSFIVCASGWTSEPEKELQFFEEMADTLEQGGNYGALSERLTPIGKEVSWRNRLIMSYGLKMANDNQAIAAALRAMPELTVEKSALQENKLPALAVVGDRDPLRTFAEQMVAATNGMDIVIVSDADHMSLLRRPTAMRAITTFLNTNKSPTTSPHPDTKEEKESIGFKGYRR